MCKCVRRRRLSCGRALAKLRGERERGERDDELDVKINSDFFFSFYYQNDVVYQGNASSMPIQKHYATQLLV